MKKLIICAVLVLCLSGCVAAPASTTETTTAPVTETTTVPATTAHVHDYAPNLVVEPSCTEGGYTVFECGCGEAYQDRITEALGHTMEETVSEATAESPGCTTHTCKYCTESYQDSFTWLAATPTDFFDDAAFIGDSITLGLRNYEMKYHHLGEVTFLCQGSYSVAHGVNNTMYISYQGQDMTPQDALAASGVNKVFILLGMNDIALHGVDKTMENWAVLIGNIREKCPQIRIFIQSGTPIYTEGQIGGLNNKRMDEYNVRLQSFARENDCVYLDVGTAMKDSTNGLASRYASDNYVHLTYAACELWVEQLKNYVCQ